MMSLLQRTLPHIANYSENIVTSIFYEVMDDNIFLAYLFIHQMNIEGIK